MTMDGINRPVSERKIEVEEGRDSNTWVNREAWWIFGKENLSPLYVSVTG